MTTITGFLSSIGSSKWADLAPYFSTNVQFIDSTGKRWKWHEEIEKQFEPLFVPYAKKGVMFQLESVEASATDTFIASVLWESVSVAGGAPKSMQRMTIVLARESGELSIILIQVTPIRIPL